MYTVLIVDDEPVVRRGVSQMIDWSSLGFTTVLQAEDGVEALEICRKNKVNLVLTDIVMPFMDGLELSGILGQEFPDIQIVILTGHEDFEYAKQSVDLGVKNYILKPVGSNTLYEKIKEICHRINIETTQKQYIAEMKTQLYQSMPVLQEKFLSLLVCTENPVEYDIHERIQNLGLPLKGKSYLVAIIELDFSEIQGRDIELYTFAAKNVVQGCMGDGHCVFENEHKLVIVFNLDYYEEAGHDIVYKTIQVTQKAIYSMLHMNNTCALGMSVDSLPMLYHSWREANKALDCKYTLGINRVYDIRDLDYVEETFFYPFEEMKNLVNSIKLMSPSEIEAAVQAVGTALHGMHNVSSSNIRMIFIEILTSLLKELSGLKEVSPDIWNEGFSLYNGLEQSMSIEQISSKLLTFSKKVSNQFQRSQKNSSEIIVQKTVDYIEAQYADEMLTLSGAAEKVGVSMGYLSILFKKEGGINFTEYLTHVRMSHAKELLRATDKKTYEIAYETGYSSPHYFSVSFKKCTGMSPSEFRSKE